MKKKNQGNGLGGSCDRLEDADFQGEFPRIFEQVADTLFEDGTKRITSTVTLFVESGVVKLCLNDRAEGLTGWVSSGTVWDAVKALEDKLQEGIMDWRAPSGKKR